jgi:hypothetical protein
MLTTLQKWLHFLYSWCFTFSTLQSAFQLRYFYSCGIVQGVLFLCGLSTVEPTVFPQDDRAIAETLLRVTLNDKLYACHVNISAVRSQKLFMVVREFSDLSFPNVS